MKKKNNNKPLLQLNHLILQPQIQQQMKILQYVHRICNFRNIKIFIFGCKSNLEKIILFPLTKIDFLR